MSTTLYESEQFLTEMLDTAEVVTPEMEQEFAVALQTAISGAVQKRERVGQFILHCESQAEFARAEARRITERARVFENAAERVRNYVRDYICAAEPVKGKPPKLQGETLAMMVRKCPNALEITGDVPSEYRTVTVTLSDRVFGDIAPLLDNVALFDAKHGIDKDLIRESIERGETVPGARLDTGRYSLQIK